MVISHRGAWGLSYRGGMKGLSFLKSLSLAAGTAVLLAACGQNQVSVSALSKADAQKVKSSLLDSDEYLLQGMFDPQNPVSASSLQAQGVGAQVATCTSTLDPITPVNADGDLIPARLSKSSDCTFRNDQNGAGLSYKGSVTLEDKDDTKPKSGFKVSNNTYTLNFYGTGGMTAAPVSNLFYKHNVDLNWNNPNYTIVNDFEFSGSSADGSFKLAYNYNASYVPDNVETPFVGGTLNFQGTVSLDTAGANNTNPKRYSLSQNSTNLKYSNACKKRFVGGTTTYTDGRGNSLVITYNSCSSVTVTYNNEAI
jgi:hypothetical protein